MRQLEIFKLFGSIFVDTAEAEKSISKTEEKASSLGSKLGEGIKTAAKWGAAIVGGATAAAGGLLAITNQTAEYADEIDKLSERTGISREELQRWKYAASQSGADIGKLEVGVKKLSDVMDDAINGNEKATEAFEKLGISIDDLKNKSQEQIFEKVMASLADMEQGAQRNALGNDLLGKSYTELLPLLNAGSEGIQELKDRADELGLVMSEDMVKANVTFGDTLQDVQLAFGSITREMTNATLPMLQQFLDFILANMPVIREIVSGVFSAIGDAVAAILPFLMNLIQNALPPLINLFTKIASEILPPVISLFNEISQLVLPLVMEVFEALLPVIEPIMNTIASVIKTALALIKGDWESVWNGLKETLSNIWETIKSIVKVGVNFVISGINTFIRGLNKIKIPDWIPGVGGKGINIKEIPLLAAGGEILERGHAIVGEAGPELVELPKGARVMPLRSDTSSKLEDSSELQKVSIEIPIYLDNREIARVITPEISKILSQKSIQSLRVQGVQRI